MGTLIFVFLVIVATLVVALLRAYTRLRDLVNKNEAIRLQLLQR